MWLSFISWLNSWMIKCVSHSTWTGQASRGLIALNRSEVWLLFKRQPRPSRQRELPLTSNSMQFITRLNNPTCWKRWRRRLQEHRTKAFGEVRMKVNRRWTVDTKQKQCRGGDKSIKQGLDRAWDQGTERWQKKRGETERWGGGSGRRNWRRQGGKRMLALPVRLSAHPAASRLSLLSVNQLPHRPEDGGFYHMKVGKNTKREETSTC